MAVPSRYSSLVAMVRLVAAHTHEIEAAMPALPAEVAAHLTAMRAHLATVDNELRQLRDEAAAEASRQRIAVVLPFPRLALVAAPRA